MSNINFALACDYMGEKLAWWFGITKPKFLYEIEEFERMKKEEEEVVSDLKKSRYRKKDIFPLPEL